MNTQITKEVFLSIAESVFKTTRANATPREYGNELERQMCAFIFNEPWRRRFIERQFMRTIVLIEYDPSPYYGDCKKCEWKAGEHVTAFLKTRRPWEEISADFCRKWSAAFLDLARADVRRFSGGTLTIKETAADPLWEERNGKIDAIADFRLVKAK